MNLHITSAAGVLALLNEPETEIKVFALNKLNQVCNVFWAEISEDIGKIEVLYEDEAFKYRHLAALVISKVYHHLGAYEESLMYALGAHELFDVNDTSEYVETTVSKCIDHYTKLRVLAAEADSAAGDVEIDPRLEQVVNRMFQRCFDDGQFKQAVGIALETRRVDIFEQAILKSGDIGGMLSYSVKVCMSLIQNRQFRHTVLRVLVQMYMNLECPDYINVCQCLIFLDDPQAVGDVLEKLLRSDNEDNILMAYQIGFDMYDSATQQFLERVQTALRATVPIATPQSPKPESSSAENKEDKPEPKETDSTMETEDGAEKVAKQLNFENLSDAEKKIQSRVTKLNAILGGETTINLHLQFLIRNNKSDLLILKNTKDSVRNSVCHSATVIANAFMHAGTTSDSFLRDNLDWLARATNWAKFTATSSLGVIHRGHEKDSRNLMSAYLPTETNSSSSYAEGGGLYALGLIHANHGGDITEYLLNQLKDASSDMIRHGGCLGLGLAAMGTANQDIYDQLKFNLYQDDAVTGEAAGIAMGLVMVGTKNAAAIEDMVTYSRETQHEKILRGLAVGIALTMYGRLEEADSLIEDLSKDKDPILRWSGMFTIAMAYCGTANNAAIRRLLHIAVSDVNDDVRRAAVMSLGFLLFRVPEQCPAVVSLLTESYNPHVRYGAAMALGISCAGSGMKEALALLEPMTNDPVNYVRQGVLLASALILVQHNEQTSSKMNHFRQLYSKIISDKHEDVMSKFGAILAQGIIDAGGRNTTVSLQSRTGHTNMQAVVGLLVFQQFWYWYPLAHFLSLAFTPTTLIGLNADLNMPKLDFVSNAKPSMFAYVPNLEEKKDKTLEKVQTAVLSTTAKEAKKKASKKGAEADKMEVDEDKDKDVQEKAEKEQTKEKAQEKMDVDEAAADAKAEAKPEEKGEKKEVTFEEKKKKPEATFQALDNPSRVMRAQLRVLSMAKDTRYTPIKDVTTGGILLLRNSRPEEKEDIVEPVEAGGPKLEEEDEPEPPEPFEWTED